MALPQLGSMVTNGDTVEVLDGIEPTDDPEVGVLVWTVNRWMHKSTRRERVRLSDGLLLDRIAELSVQGMLEPPVRVVVGPPPRCNHSRCTACPGGSKCDACGMFFQNFVPLP
jgi:hypothetical protein